MQQLKLQSKEEATSPAMLLIALLPGQLLSSTEKAVLDLHNNNDILEVTLVLFPHKRLRRPCNRAAYATDVDSSRFDVQEAILDSLAHSVLPSEQASVCSDLVLVTWQQSCSAEL